MDELSKVLLPEMINTKSDFMASEFRDGNMESIARNVVIIQNVINPKSWNPFTFEDYKKSCRHEVSDLEKDFLEVLVDGGKIPHGCVTLSPGYLFKDLNGNYHITTKFLGAIAKFVIK